jgi:hypothetical protein
MPVTTRCPSCDRKLRIPDNLLGSRVKCPGCQTTFVAEVPQEGPLEEVPPEAPPRRPREEVTDRPSGARRRPALTPPPEEDEGDGAFQDEPDDYDDRPRRRRGGSRARALEVVSAPAVALMVTGGIGIALGVLFMVMSLIGGSLQLAMPGPAGRGAPDASAAMFGTAFNVIHAATVIICGAIVLYGAIQMKGLSSRGWAMTSSIVAMVPCVGCCLLGLPFGIWSIVVLGKPEVVRAFG